jgi:8-oxo-dGTP pyrophosphatase MutT (NUDIX family)
MASIQNVSIILFTQQEKTLRVLLVKEKRGTWGFPGGKIEKDDKSSANAMRRELLEEINLDLKEIEKLPYYDYEGHTRIYIGKTGDSVNLANISSNEISEARWAKWDDVVQSVYGTPYDLRRCVKNSLKKMIEKKVFS